jgi:glucose-6-phosphate dehydrogenase assembly protein OpcA
VADALAVDTWDAQGVTLTEIAEALSDLRHRSAGAAAGARTAVMTLIAVAAGDDHAYSATQALRMLGRHHPARIVLLRPEPDQVAALDARAVLYAIEHDGYPITFEEVTLIVGGQAAHHLDSVVEAFTLSDLPIVVWYVNDVPDPADPLLAVASAVLLDSRDAADTGRMRSLLELARRRTVVDLSWIRLEPWRALLAGLFDAPPCRAWIDSVERVEVRGKIGPRQLLGGWLVAQLGLLPRQVTLVDSRHVEIRVMCRQGDQQALFEVGRGDADRVVAARAELPGGVAKTQTAQLADDPLPTALAEGLTHLDPDTVWEKALSTATLLSS